MSMRLADVVIVSTKVWKSLTPQAANNGFRVAMNQQFYQYELWAASTAESYAGIERQVPLLLIRIKLFPRLVKGSTISSDRTT